MSGVMYIWKRDNTLCWLCFDTVLNTEASRDHVIPRYYGGLMDAMNLALAHRDCNSARNHMTWSQYQFLRCGSYRGVSDKHWLYAQEIIKRAHKASRRRERVLLRRAMKRATVKELALKP